jgi:hypothetical protein
VLAFLFQGRAAVVEEGDSLLLEKKLEQASNMGLTMFVFEGERHVFEGAVEIGSRHACATSQTSRLAAE